MCLNTCSWDGVRDDCGIEGLSCVLPMFVAVPLKYALGIAIAVHIVGLAQGMLFLAALVAAWIDRPWGGLPPAGISALSLLPFGAPVMEHWLRKDAG